jgi:hypothetical protein
MMMAALNGFPYRAIASATAPLYFMVSIIGQSIIIVEVYRVLAGVILGWFFLMTVHLAIMLNLALTPFAVSATVS